MHVLKPLLNKRLFILEKHQLVKKSFMFYCENQFSIFLDLWLAYVDHLKQHQSLDFVTISRVHSRALHALDSDELKRFNTECALKNLT